MQENNQEETKENSYQVFIANVVFDKTPIKAFRSKYSAKQELPTELSFNVPDTKLQKIRSTAKTEQDFKDLVEEYIYDTLTHKYMHEVRHAQIWLPIEEA